MNKIYFIILLALISCSKEKRCNTEKEFFIDSVDAPAEGMINQNVHVEAFMHSGACKSFKKFKVTGSKKDRTLIPIVDDNTCISCLTVIQPFSATYTFVPREKGIYTLRFKTKENTYIQTQIKVE